MKLGLLDYLVLNSMSAAPHFSPSPAFPKISLQDFCWKYHLVSKSVGRTQLQDHYPSIKG